MYALQAITTKFLPATETKGARIKATTASGLSVVIGYPYEFSGVDCHAAAAEKLARKLGWLGSDCAFADQYVAGATATGYVFVEYRGAK